MVEEFHGTEDVSGVREYKLLYGWNTLNANIWLPSLCELVGYTGTQNAGNGCYYSAMQGLNTSTGVCVDAQGGVQFAYFKRYNTTGGGEAIIAACKQQASWLRSPKFDYATTAWRTTNATTFNTSLATDSCAVHPAVKNKFIHNKSQRFSTAGQTIYFRKRYVTYAYIHES